MDNRPIGIFDSGVGGLTVVKQVMEALPNEDLIYVGDTARVPYGAKSEETVARFSSQIVRFLLSKEVKAIIIACNTASSNCYPQLVEEFSVPFIEVVTPGVEACLDATKTGVIGVIGTEATVRSKAYERALIHRRPDVRVYMKACPLFVPLAEEGWTANSVAKLTAEIYLQEFADKEIDTLVLACTHYPLLKTTIQKVVAGVHVVDPAVFTAAKMKNFLFEAEMKRQLDQTPRYDFYVTDNTTKFERISKLVLGQVYAVQKIDIESFF